MPSLHRPVVRLYGYFQPQGNHAARDRPASSRGDSSHDDGYEHEERAFRAAFECRLAVVRAILGELSPGRCDGAPRGLEVYSRDRDCTTTCGTFALGLGTSPEDAPRRLGLVLSFWGLGCCGIVELGVTQNARNRVHLASAKRQRSVRSRAPQIRLRNDEQRCCRDQKLLHPILHGPAQVDKMRQTVLALAICGASALQPARNARRQSLAVRQAPRGVRQRTLDGVRVETRESRRHRRDEHEREYAIAATTYDAGRRRLRRVRHVLLHDDGEAGLVRFVGQGAQREM